MSRRALIAGGPACIAAGLARDQSAAAAEEPPAAARALPVGYWPGISPEPARVRAAAGLPAADPAVFAGGARVTVHGLGGAAPRGPVSVRARFPIRGDARVRETIVFDAWRYAPSTVPAVSSSVRFVMPVDPVAGIAFGISAPGRPEEHVLPLGPGLTPGWYLIALPDEGALPVDWERYRFEAPAGGVPAFLFTLRDEAREPVPFSYLVLSIESVPRTGEV